MRRFAGGFCACYAVGMKEETFDKWRHSIDMGKYDNHLPYGRETESRKLWRAEQARLMEEFKVDLLAYLSLVGHPKADLLFDLAWDMGHSSGLLDVVDASLNLVELIR